MEGLPYRLYTDASDEALGCALQQIQPIAIKDLKGTRLHGQLEKAHRAGKQPPNLVMQLPSALKDGLVADNWAEEFESTIVYIERVITYWSCTFKSAEVRYSTTEREALAAKEGLVKFQPFIEGEKLTLITDHAALQWAKTYKNSIPISLSFTGQVGNIPMSTRCLDCTALHPLKTPQQGTILLRLR